MFYQPLSAADVSWVATTNNANWTNTNNWSGGVLPGAADNVFLTNGNQTWLTLSASTGPTMSNLTIGTNGSSSLRLFGDTGVLTVSEAITVTGGGTRLIFSTTGSNSTYYALQTPLLNASGSTIDVRPGAWVTVGPDSTWELNGLDLNAENQPDRANFRINGGTVDVNVAGGAFSYGVMLSRGANETSTLFMDAGMLIAKRIGIGRRQAGFQDAGTGSLEWTGGTISNRAGVDLVFNSYDITDNYGFQINLTNAGDKTLSVASGRIAHVGPNANNLSAPGVIAGTNTSGAYLTGTEGRLVIAGGGTVRLYQSNSYSGQVKIDNGTLTLVGGSETFDGVSGTYSGSIAPSALEIATAGTLDLQNGTGLGGSGTVSFTGGLLRFSSNSVADLSGRIANSTGAIRIDTGANTVTFASTLASNNTGGLSKTGTGTLVLSASNAFTGVLAVQTGVLNLSSSTGFAAGSVSSVTVATNATLLIAQGGQVNDNTSVTLSGGTIRRASGASEVFGSLNLTESSFLDFSGGTAGTMTFGGISYTPSALLALDIANFNQGSMLVFQTTNNLSMTGFTFSGSGGFGSSSFNGSTFTITAIPEPSTYLVALGILVALLAAPATRPSTSASSPSKTPTPNSAPSARTGASLS